MWDIGGAGRCGSGLVPCYACPEDYVKGKKSFGGAFVSRVGGGVPDREGNLYCEQSRNRLFGDILSVFVHGWKRGGCDLYYSGVDAQRVQIQKYGS